MSYWTRRIRLALPAIFVMLISVAGTLLVMMPAAWIVPQFSKATGGHVNLVDPSGSLWQGSATLMLAAGSDGAGATLLPGRIEWTTSFLPLFTGRIHMTMRQTDAMPDAVILDASPRGATLTAGQIAVPATLLAGLGAPFNTLDFDGAVRLSWTEFRLLNRNAYGQVVVTLDDMASRVSRVKPLGSYRVALQAQGASATIDLTTSKGPLMLSGNGSIAPESTSFQGTATAAPEQRENLAGLLNLLGRHTDPDTVALTFMR
ncbi:MULTISPECIES: type II secretion system protein N [Caballeronia]|uniref:type II secretion system protein N n=1 Tax=Caballeronia TaxID=1827195 RepID=UPI00045EEB53|nr:MULTISPECIES: type II secretion system protein N [unclassified Caballeronia]MCE4543329.1 type II secretion system protein N [Caballeronia sp. PC1]MCE4567615.1 type II secretion system protein N [Caballeronia sp. CLC5]BAO87806.1 putative general secretory pathway protein N [Burkholderia sp. RPE67]BBP97730.1 general secretory pathway protein GspN [Burkholderia sp. SFA1]